MKDFEKETKIQENVEEENQRISELDGNLITHVSYYHDYRKLE